MAVYTELNEQRFLVWLVVCSRSLLTLSIDTCSSQGLDPSTPLWRCNGWV